MQLDSLSFWGVILPALTVLCWLCPARRRAAVVLAASLGLYVWAAGWATALLAVGVAAWDFWAARQLPRLEGRPRVRRGLLAASLLKDLGVFAACQVWAQLQGQGMPLGMGVVCLTAAGYLLDCYLHNTFPEPSWVDYGLMLCFFPKLYAGPMVYHSRLMPQIKGMHMTLDRTARGVQYFLRGLAKKVIIGDTVEGLAASLYAVPQFELSTLGAWTLVLTQALAVYFLLGGLCEMAKGAGLLFGLELPDNFRYPYGATSVNDFFSRFNSSLSKYLRRYVYLYLGGAKGGFLSSLFNILLFTILMGLWFGVSVNLVAWGVYFTVFVLLERYLLEGRAENIPTLFRWLYCTAVVLCSFALFGGSSLGQSWGYLRAMFRLAPVPAVDSGTLYLLASNHWLLLVAVLCSAGVFHWVAGLGRRLLPRLWEALAVAFYGALSVLTLAFLI